METTNATGYVNGSDVLVSQGGKCYGHSTSHTTTYSTETKKRSVKPEASKARSQGKWTETSVTGLGIKINIKGLRVYDESELTYADLLNAWHSATPIDIECFDRDNKEKPYLKGKFVITNITEEGTADDDLSYTVDLENYGMPESFAPENLVTTTPATV